ncbi:MAG: ECF transporter S component [Candidatus Methanofastidiosia archaeon]|jgi:uncharacterized membrane protein
MPEKGIFTINARELAISAIFAAVVCAATLIIRIPVPATAGYINLGDSMIFVSALLFGARIGGIAGGVGSALADILGGFGSWAPFTLVIKGTEGAVVGWLSRRGDTISKKTVSVGVSIVLFVIGLLGLYLFQNPEMGTVEAAMVELNILLVVAALYLFFVSLDISYFYVAVITGGLIMITGYFIVESVLYGIPAALAELPGNFFQAGSGLIIAIPVVKAINRALPQKV